MDEGDNAQPSQSNSLTSAPPRDLSSGGLCSCPLSTHPLRPPTPTTVLTPPSSPHPATRHSQPALSWPPPSLLHAPIASRTLCFFL